MTKKTERSYTEEIDGFKITTAGSGKSRYSFGSCPMCGTERSMDEHGYPVAKLVAVYLRSCVKSPGKATT
jgi:hypothetical protein